MTFPRSARSVSVKFMAMGQGHRIAIFKDNTSSCMLSQIMPFQYNTVMPVVLFLASKADEEFSKPISDTLKEFGVTVETVIASAHKVPEIVIDRVKALNTSAEPIVIITCVGRSNGLSGVVAGSAVHPVIACPVLKDKTDYMVNIHSTLQMPSDVPVMTVLEPVNAALAAVRILGESDAELKEKMMKRIQKIKAGY